MGILIDPYAYGGGLDAADFDGTNDYMTRGADLTGNADSKLFTFSFWYRLDGGDGSTRKFIANATGVAGATTRFSIQLDTANNLNLIGRNAAGTNVLIAVSTNTFVASEAWNILMVSIDLSDTGKRFVYSGNTAVSMGWTTYTDDAIDFAQADWSIGAQADGSGKFNGCFAEPWFNVGSQIDLSVEANRRLFLAANGRPANLGTDGSVPTGTPPLVYCHLNKADAVENFATNRGAGGNFTITGALETCSTAP